LRGDEEPEVEDVANQRSVDQDPKRVERDSAKEKSIHNLCASLVGFSLGVYVLRIYGKGK